MPISVCGEYEIVQHRNGEEISQTKGNNNITFEGIGHLLNSAFLASNSNRSTIWYICLIQNMVNRVTGEVTPVTLNYDDNLNRHSFTQFTNIDGEFSPEWDPTAASLIGNLIYIQNTPIQITITDPNIVPLGGLFICNDGNLPVSGDGSDTMTSNHILWATAMFQEPIRVTNGDILSIQYKVKVGIS